MAILHATTKMKVKISQELIAEESLILSDLSVRFEAMRLRAPILSVYEAKETKIPEGRFKHKKLIVCPT